MANDRRDYNDVLCHHGIKGQKWGTRRYQYEDGTWTAAGKARRRDGEGKYDKQVSRVSGDKVSRRTFKKSLNKLSKYHDRASYELIKQERDVKKAQKKFDKVQKKVDKKGDNASDRLLKKLDKRAYTLKKEKSDVGAVKKDVKRNEAATNKVIEKALKSGYSIKSKEYTKNANEGKRFAANYLFGVAGAIATQARYKDDRIRATSYKVTKTKKGQKAAHTKKIKGKQNTSGVKYALAYLLHSDQES